MLTHLERVGFDDAGVARGRDEETRDIVSFVAGDVPIPPYPAWMWSDDTLVARWALPRYHAAVSAFDADGVFGWETDWADPFGIGVVCHNDPFPENVVFRNGMPSRSSTSTWPRRVGPFGDVAIAAHEWCPLKAGSTDDAVRRFGVLAAAPTALPTAAGLVDIVFEEWDNMATNIRRHEVTSGNRVS